MRPSTDHGRTGVAAAVRRDTRRRPVMLATLDVPLDREAARVAVDSAVESGQPLVLANVVPTAFTEVVLANWDYLPRPEVEESLRRPAELARSLGVEVERLRVRSPHPVDALLEVAAELQPALLVFGPDRMRIRGRRYRRAARSIEQRCTCLVWLA